MVSMHNNCIIPVMWLFHMCDCFNNSFAPGVISDFKVAVVFESIAED